MTEYAHPESLVSTQWVAEHLDDPNVRFVEIIWGMDEVAGLPVYENGHIPGAVAWDFIGELTKQYGDAINGDIAGKNEVEELLSRSGVTPHMGIVLCDRHSNLIAAYTFWLLKYYGHQDIRLINGNVSKWLSEDRTTETVHPSFTATNYKTQDPNSSLRASRDYIIDTIGSPNLVIVDTRTTEMYSGENNANAKHGGHIPGAVNLAAWRKSHPDGTSAGWGVPTANADGTFKSADELKAIVRDLGITEDKEMVTYCIGGGLSSNAWFVLTQLLGYENVREYERSWNEWGNLPETPIEK
jgi:thiosulfate/3-mercaptopyruvate sulfurtransferase